ncbi:MAG: sulfotransferase [Deltaproteobacteria bacterium]|nr:sulfotransferase [Deltaproteobacteria bacterium]
MTRTYSFRDGGLHSPLLRGLNVVGSALASVGLRLTSLEPDALVDAAVRRAGSSDLGSDSYREPLETYCDSLESEARLSSFGRIALRGMIVSALTTRIELQAWTKANPEARQEEIVRPWIIIGLPRTGTSLLSQLLALDPLSRAPLQWETRSPVPPPSLSGATQDPRIAKCSAQLARIAKLNPAVEAMHPFGAMLSEECVPFFMLDLRTLGMETQALVQGYGQWLQACDMTPAYEQHRRALQALQTGQPTEHWVLKTPNHLWALETLLGFYPDARLIWTHRDPGSVVTSVASLNTTLQRMFSDRVDHMAVGRDWKNKLTHAVDLGMAYDDRAEPGWCVHVSYAELMWSPLAAIRAIYAHFGDRPSRLHERRVEVWLEERHQSVHGRHGYDPADFGWSYEGLAEEFQGYRDRYGIEPEKR